MVVNPETAKHLGLKEGDLVKVVSATNPSGEWDLGAGNKKPMIGKVVFILTCVQHGTIPALLSTFKIPPNPHRR